jgi:8-amino-7-oxononanoate synthase
MARESLSTPPDPHAFLRGEVLLLRRDGLLRKLPSLGGAPGPRIRINGRDVLLLCSNNYLGLATDARVIHAAQDALERYGAGATGSRLISGNLEPYCALEKELARFKGAQAALVFTSGYQANVGTISALAGPGDAVFCDALNHASLIDGARLSRARIAIYRHCDPEDLERKLRLRAKAGRKLIVTESVFSMDGDLAPLVEIAAIAEEHGALLMVDEAHATGLFGATGAGLVEALGLAQRVDVQMGTFSKALGSLGGYIAGSREMIQFLLHRARSFVFTTGLPPPVIAASTEALRIACAEPERRQALWRNIALLKTGLERLGFVLGPTQSQILPVLLYEERATMAACRYLLRQGVFVQGIRPPTVPPGTSRLRLAPMATHTEQDMEEVLEALGKLQECLSRNAQPESQAPALLRDH